jgi:hypothetical protein
MGTLQFKNYVICSPTNIDTYNQPDWKGANPSLRAMTFPQTNYTVYRNEGFSQGSENEEKHTFEITRFFTTWELARQFRQDLDNLKSQYPCIAELYYSEPCKNTVSVYEKYVKIDNVDKSKKLSAALINGVRYCKVVVTVTFSITWRDEDATIADVLGV